MISINEWLSQTPFGIPRQGLKSYVHTYLDEEVRQEGLTRNMAAFARSLLTLTQDGLPCEAPADILAQPAYVWFLTPTELP